MAAVAEQGPSSTMAKGNSWEMKPATLVKEIDTGLESVFCTRYSSDGELIAAGSSDGKVKLFNNSGRCMYKFAATEKDMPTTSLAWRPRSESLGSLQVLVTVNVWGEIKHWHVPSQKQIYRIQEEGNEIYVLKYRNDGLQFVTGGKDAIVRVYDEETKTVLHTLERGIYSHSIGHSNRIFAASYKPDDNNILVTAGWDNTVLVWDLRENKAVKTIYGPHVAGSALDISNDTILTGSWRSQDGLECWDFKTGRNTMRIGKCPMIYCAQFLPNSSDTFVAGGTSELNELKIYSTDGSSKSKPMHLKSKRGIYTCDTWGEKVVVGGDHACLRVFES